MPNEKLLRKDFLKSLAGIKRTNKITTLSNNATPPPNEPDLLFKKYARKKLGARQYTPTSNDNLSINRVVPVISGLTPYTGVWTIWEVNHLLRRLSFGATIADVNTLLALTPSAAIDKLMTYNSTPTLPSPTPVNYYQSVSPDSSGVNLGASWTSTNLTYANANDGTTDYYREQSYIAWGYGVMLNDITSIREKMTLFWYHFITINIEEVRNDIGNAGTAGNDYFNILRTNALGNFKSLIKAIAKSPAMLAYLGGQLSTATAPNENFGRELMELFTLGKVPTQNYTEQDVQAAAKIFSGWYEPTYGYGTYPLTASFNPGLHNQLDKTFSSFFGNITIPNMTGTGGAAEFDIFFDVLFGFQQTQIANYLCTRLYRFFVHYDIDANIQTNVITPMANLLIANSWNVVPVVATLFKSQHFFDMANRGVMEKSPMDLIIGTIRSLNVNTTAAAGASQVLNQYNAWWYLQYYSLYYLEQGYGLVPNVAGWKAYYQGPTYYQNWISSFTIQNRSSFLTNLMNGINYGTLMQIDVLAFVKQFPNTTVQDPDLLIAAVVPYLFPIPLDTTFITNTKIATLLSGQITNNYWTTAWNNYVADPTNVSKYNIVKSRLTSLLTTFLQLAEFQLM